MNRENSNTSESRRYRRLEGEVPGQCRYSTKFVDLGETYYNPKPQVEALEALRRKLPDPATPAPPAADRPIPGRARQLDTDQVRELIAGYKSGETVYQLGARFGCRCVAVA
jgi:hypothetical protein